MTFSIPQSKHAHHTCGICGHKKSRYEYVLTRINKSNPYINPEARTIEWWLCNHCDFNLPYDPEPGDGE